jgi:hypothetical protein
MPCQDPAAEQDLQRQRQYAVPEGKGEPPDIERDRYGQRRPVDRATRSRTASGKQFSHKQAGFSARQHRAKIHAANGICNGMRLGHGEDLLLLIARGPKG